MNFEEMFLNGWDTVRDWQQLIRYRTFDGESDYDGIQEFFNGVFTIAKL